MRALRGFQRVSLARAPRARLTFTLDQEDFALLDEQLERVVEAGTFTVFVGGSASAPEEAKFEVVDTLKLEGVGSAIPRSMRPKPAASAKP